MNRTYDREHEWTALPLGAKLAKLVRLHDMPVALSGAKDYDLYDNVMPGWAFNLTVRLLFQV
jgi:hypothetical protein